MTLISGIESTLDTYQQVCANPDAAIKNLLTAAQKTSPLLREVIEGKTTFVETYQPILEHYNNWLNFFVPPWIKRYEKDLAKENRVLIDDYGLTKQAKALFTPLTLSLAGTGLAMLVEASVEMANNNSPVGFILGFATVVGTALKSNQYFERIKLERDLKFLDKQVAKYFHQ